MSILPSWLQKPTLISHRGEEGPQAPENSKAAFLKAIDKKMPIEMDVVLTQDLVPIVFHDSTLQRLTNARGVIGKMTWEEIKKAQLSNGETLHTLDEILTLISGQVPVIVDLKPQWHISGKQAAKAVGEVLHRHSPHNPDMATQSFSPIYLRHIQPFAPQVARGQLSYFFEDLLFIGYCRPDYVATDFKSMHFLIGLRKGLGLPLVGWGIEAKDLEQGQQVFDRMIVDAEDRLFVHRHDLKQVFEQAQELLAQAQHNVEALWRAREALLCSDVFAHLTQRIENFFRTPSAWAERDVVSLTGDLTQDLQRLQHNLEHAPNRWHRLGERLGTWLTRKRQSRSTAPGGHSTQPTSLQRK